MKVIPAIFDDREIRHRVSDAICSCQRKPRHENPVANQSIREKENVSPAMFLKRSESNAKGLPSAS
jgi:hypothetical protein